MTRILHRPRWSPRLGPEPQLHDARSVVLRDERGHLLPLEPNRWYECPSPSEGRLLDGIRGPALDVGCGPGRVVEGLAHRGQVALGVDPAPGAVRLTRSRGCAALQRSVFDAIPGEGRWATVLLMDGNVGIGGDPVRLLGRCRELACETGEVVVEVESPGRGWRRCRARLERGTDMGDWFDWAVVSADAIAALAGAADMTLEHLHRTSDARWFAHLEAKRPTSAGADIARKLSPPWE